MGRHFWRDWIAANALGELVGLGIAVVIAVAVARAHALPPAEEILIVTAAFLVIGAYEGAIVGTAQWLVLRRALPSLRARSWIGATVAGAVMAWLLGRIPSALADWKSVSGGSAQTDPSAPVALLLILAAGAALGVILGTAQWVVLRVHVRHAALWIVANALAWAAAMPMIVLAAGIPEPHTSALAIGALALATVGLTGVVAGAIEGVCLTVLLRKHALIHHAVG